MVDDTTIIEEITDTESKLEQRTQSFLCALGLHRRTRWGKPFSRKGATGFFVSFGESSPQGTGEREYFFQIRECKGCGLIEERSVS